MTKIIKNGNYKNKIFCCNSCGCVFETDEYLQDAEEKKAFPYSDLFVIDNIYWCAECPNCRQQTFEVQTVIREIEPNEIIKKGGE